MKSISKKEYFLSALKAEAHYHREWMIRLLTIAIDDPTTDSDWGLKHTKDAVLVLVPEVGWIPLEEAIPYEIPIVYHDFIGSLKAGDVINLDRDISKVTYGDVLVNARVLGYATGSSIPFIEGPFSPRDIERVFIERLKDEPNDPKDWVEGEVYPYHWLRCGKAIGDLDGFEMVIPSLTEQTLQPYDGLEEHKAKLLGSYDADQLMDPVIQARIQDELVARYKEHLKGDPSEGFLFKDKFITTCLKQMFLIHGPESGFTEGGLAKFIPTSLDQGINVDYYPEMMDSLRAGAYFRGALTALAGTDVDLFGRIFQGSNVDQTFCKTTQTLDGVVINKQHIERYILVDGKRLRLTKDELPKYLNTKQSMYDPSYCRASDNNICLICIGGRMAEYPTSLGSAVTEKQSVLMSVMMASAHAKQLKTTKLKSDWLK